MLKFCSSVAAPCLALGFSTVFLASKPVCVRAITPEEKARLDQLKREVKTFVANEKNYRCFEKDLKFIIYPPVFTKKGTEDIVAKEVGDSSRVYSDENEFKQAHLEYLKRIGAIIEKSPSAGKIFKITKNESTNEFIQAETNAKLLLDCANNSRIAIFSSFFNLERKLEDFFKNLGNKLKKQALKERFCEEVKQALLVLKAVHWAELDSNEDFYQDSLTKLGAFFKTVENILKTDEEEVAFASKSCRLLSEKSI